MPSSPIAVYERVVGASLERVWENVLDWEHLPWLHRTTFGHVRLLERSPDGWHAEASMRAGGAPFVLDVALERAALLYHARTVDGPGAGTDIVTRLVPRSPHATAIHVAFHVPDVPAAHRDAIGGAYVRLYTQLWDEDEAMMIRRQLVVDGRLDEPERMVTLGGAPCRFSTICPHLGGPLADAPVDDAGVATCPWHGRRVDVRTGRLSAAHSSYSLEP